MGEEPSHPELLDWLASDLIASGWQVKRLHRWILTSATYRQRGTRPETATRQQRWAAAVKRDPDVIWLSRFPRRRLEAEVIRDAMYAASSSLNLRMGGPSALPPLPVELVSTLLKDQWNPTVEVPEHYRRSVYVFARRNLRYPMLAMFDRPSANRSCAMRQASTTAPQSLFMLNSMASLDAARRLAGSVMRETDGLELGNYAEQAVRRTYGRNATREEQELLVKFMNSQKEISAQRNAGELALPIPRPPEARWRDGAALTDLCLALLNGNEFVYLD